MTLLYKMHLPPGLPLDELASLQVESDTYDVVESAAEMTEIEHSDSFKEESVLVVKSLPVEAGLVEDIEDVIMTPPSSDNTPILSLQDVAVIMTPPSSDNTPILSLQ